MRTVAVPSPTATSITSFGSLKRVKKSEDKLIGMGQKTKTSNKIRHRRLHGTALATICTTARPGEPSVTLSLQDIVGWRQTILAGQVIYSPTNTSLCRKKKLTISHFPTRPAPFCLVLICFCVCFSLAVISGDFGRGHTHRWRALSWVPSTHTSSRRGGYSKRWSCRRRIRRRSW